MGARGPLPNRPRPMQQAGTKQGGQRCRCRRAHGRRAQRHPQRPRACDAQSTASSTLGCSSLRSPQLSTSAPAAVPLKSPAASDARSMPSRLRRARRKAGRKRCGTGEAAISNFSWGRGEVPREEECGVGVGTGVAVGAAGQTAHAWEPPRQEASAAWTAAHELGLARAARGLLPRSWALYPAPPLALRQ
jgi:hypothetical protein